MHEHVSMSKTSIISAKTSFNVGIFIKVNLVNSTYIRWKLLEESIKFLITQCYSLKVRHNNEKRIFQDLYTH